ncbi:hypothetical protein GPALN_014139 [Globodera pallida]|nr:hypothetical protein GPALN_014139 [Globodera pallida]
MNSQHRHNEREALRRRLNLLVDEVDIVVQELINEYHRMGLIDEIVQPAAQQAIDAPVWLNLDHVQQQQMRQEQQQQFDEALNLDIGPENVSWDGDVSPPLSPNTYAHMIQNEVDGLRIDLMNSHFVRMARLPEQINEDFPLPPAPSPPQHWGTPHRIFDRHVPRRSLSPAVPLGPIGPVQPQLGEGGPTHQELQAIAANLPAPDVSPVAVEGESKFFDNCTLCLGRHGEDVQVSMRGNRCHCVAICTTCYNNGWWEQYVQASALQADRAVEENEDPFTQLPRPNPDSIERWISAHDRRARCLQCHAARVDFMLDVVRPRRSQRTRKMKRHCPFC